MDASAGTDAKPGKSRAAQAVLGALFGLPAYFLFLLMSLALGASLRLSGLVSLVLYVLVPILLALFFIRRVLGRGEAGEPGRRLGALGLLALAAGVLLYALHAHWQARAEAAKRGIAGRGFPVSLAEFREELPDSRYACAPLSAVEKDFDPVFYTKITHADGGGARWTSETAKIEAVYAARFTPYLEKRLAPVLKQKYTRYMKVDYVQAAAAPLRMHELRLWNITTIAKAAKLCAVSRAAEGDTGEAWELARLPFSISAILLNERTLFSKMAALAIRAQGVDAAEGILLNRPGAAIPKDVLDRLKEASEGNLAGEGFRSELAYQYDVYNFMNRADFRLFSGLGSLSGMLMSSPGTAGLRVEYAVFSILRGIGIFDLNSIATGAYFTGVDETGPWEEIYQQSIKAEASAAALPAWPYFLVKDTLPSFFRLKAREFDVQARARLTLALAELRAWRQAHGKYPAKLSELKPEAGPDVFSGKEFIYTPMAGGFDLCSAGASGDKKDTSGKDLCIRQRP